MNDRFRIEATYERVKHQMGADPEAHFFADQSLGIVGTGDLPKASDVLLQINRQCDPQPYRIVIPESFTQLKYFVTMATDLPVNVEYGESLMVSVIEKNGDKILAHTTMRYRTV